MNNRLIITTGLAMNLIMFVFGYVEGRVPSFFFVPLIGTWVVAGLTNMKACRASSAGGFKCIMINGLSILAMLAGAWLNKGK